MKPSRDAGRIISMSTLVSLLLLGLFVLVAIPITLAGAVVGMALYIAGQILMLPFRLAGHRGISARVIFGPAKLFLAIALAALAVVALVLGLFPLLAFLLVVVGLWLVLRAARRPPAPHSA